MGLLLFGADAVDFAMPLKIYGTPVESTPERKYSPDICTDIDIRVITASPT
jgi:hypothetical protein